MKTLISGLMATSSSRSTSAPSALIRLTVCGAVSDVAVADG